MRERKRRWGVMELKGNMWIRRSGMGGWEGGRRRRRKRMRKKRRRRRRRRRIG